MLQQGSRKHSYSFLGLLKFTRQLFFFLRYPLSAFRIFLLAITFSMIGYIVDWFFLLSAAHVHW